MLVLGRERDQSVVIDLGDGQRATVVVVDIRGDKVRLGFTAPRECTIHRQEVWDKIQRERYPTLGGD